MINAKTENIKAELFTTVQHLAVKNGQGIKIELSVGEL